MRSSRSKPVVECEILGILLKNLIILHNLKIFKRFSDMWIKQIMVASWIAYFSMNFGKTPRTAMLFTLLNCIFPVKFENQSVQIVYNFKNILVTNFEKIASMYRVEQKHSRQLIPPLNQFHIYYFTFSHRRSAYNSLPLMGHAYSLTLRFSEILNSNLLQLLYFLCQLNPHHTLLKSTANIFKNCPKHSSN